MLKTHEKYTAELNESQKSGKSRTKSFEGSVSKLNPTKVMTPNKGQLILRNWVK